MTQGSIAEAQQRLPKLLSSAQAGEAAMIRSYNDRTFTLAVQHSASLQNPDWVGYAYAGGAKGQTEIRSALTGAEFGALAGRVIQEQKEQQP